MPMPQNTQRATKVTEFESLSNILISSKELPQIDDAVDTVAAAEPKGSSPEVSSSNEHAGNSQVNGNVTSTTAAVADEKNNALNGHAFKRVRKRDGRMAAFDPEHITRAISKAMDAVGEGNEQDARQVTQKVVENIMRHNSNGHAIGIEYIQDEVEKALILDDYARTAKAYILYRNKRAEERAKEVKRVVPDKVKQLHIESQKYFANPLAALVYYRTYSKWMPEEGRRETWVETVDRFMDFMEENLGDKLTLEEYTETRQAILDQDVCPSMRLLWAAGPAARRSNVAAYNCSYLAPTKLQDFGEIMYILMNGVGLGFSVEHENVEQLPQIQMQTGEKLPTHVVDDSKEGWADAFVLGLNTWFSGKDIDFDYSQIRPAGARLNTMGGRASGPKPLIDLIEFSRKKILSKQGRRLRTIDVHDMICKIGDIVVAGGVRRSALISLSDLDDHNMREAKMGQFYLSEPQRSMANNSAVYAQKPSTAEFMSEWMSLIKSQTGERGIFNRGGLEKQLPRRRWQAIKDQRQTGVNPCGEIILRSKQFCNLTSIVVRAKDTAETLERKMKVATLLGTYQSTLTKFEYLSKEWQENCEEERLLGVSITGYYDNALSRDPYILKRLREVSIEVNQHYADRFGINRSTAITTLKPHGNSSQFLDTASGMHPRFAPYYVRRVRISKTDPLLATVRDQGVPCFPEVGQTEENAHTFVLEFPVAAPKGAITKDQVSAIELLQEWKKIKENFTEHNPSVTIYVGEDEWIEVANFLYENWDIVGGLSFLPRSDHVYQLAPYEEISQEEYERRVEAMGEVDFSQLYLYEQKDHTTGAKELACVSGACEI